MNFIIKNVINLIEIKNSGENEASYKVTDIFFLAGHPSSKFSIEHVIHCFKINELSRLDRSGIVKRMNYSFTQRVTNDLYI